MSHLTDQELEDWRERGDPDARERVLDHLVSCEECRQRFVELVRTAPAARSTFDVDAFLRRGLQIGTPQRRFGWSLWIGAGGLAVAAAAVFLMVRTPVEQPGVPGTRGSELVAIAPVGDVTSVGDFRWRSPVRAAKYRVTVRSHAAVVLTLDTQNANESLAIPAGATLPPGDYQWSVEALDASGKAIVSSTPIQFAIRVR